MMKSTRRKAAARTPRPAAGAEPRNQSRAAGAPAPASAASEVTRAGFYAPQGDSPHEASAAASALGAGLDEAAAGPRTFARYTRAQAIEGDGFTVDENIARQRLADEADTPEDAQEVLHADIARIREMRRPLGQHAQKLYLAPRDGYHRHWFNDEGGRIDDALNNGWANVKDHDGKPYRRAVGRGRDQGVLYAYAMELPEVFWQEDMSARHKSAADKMDALKAAPVRSQRGQSQRSDAGKFYSPVEGEGILEIEKH